MKIIFRNKLAEFYSELERIRKECGRQPDQIEVLFATKYLTERQLAVFIKEYRDLRPGKVLIGENRVQSAEEKLNLLSLSFPDLSGKFTPVLIGNLQKNKINKALR